MKKNNSKYLTRTSGGVISSQNILQHLRAINESEVNEQIVLALVTDIILDSSHSKYESDKDIGKCIISFFDKSSNENTTVAFPLSYDTKYPYKNEVVLVISFLGRYYYMSVLNINNDITNNINNLLSNAPFSDEELAESKRYNKKPKINFGDTLFTGRKFNFIKMLDDSSIYISSNEADVNNIKENTVYDDTYDKYKSIVWLTTEDIDFKPSIFGKSNYLKSTQSSYKTITKNSIVLSSDKIIINSNVNDVSIFARESIYLNTIGYIGIDSIKDINITTKENVIISSIKTNVNSKNINLGDSPTEPLVLGNKLVEILSELLEELSKEKHMTGTGISSPPDNAASYIRIKSKLNNILSKQNKTL